MNTGVASVVNKSPLLLFLFKDKDKGSKAEKMEDIASLRAAYFLNTGLDGSFNIL